MDEPVTVTMVGGPCVVLWDGETAVQLHDSFEGALELPPVTRAVMVARLRALADLLDLPEGC